jgi:hypothetical protein
MRRGIAKGAVLVVFAASVTARRVDRIGSDPR